MAIDISKSFDSKNRSNHEACDSLAGIGLFSVEHASNLSFPILKQTRIRLQKKCLNTIEKINFFHKQLLDMSCPWENKIISAKKSSFMPIVILIMIENLILFKKIKSLNFPLSLKYAFFSLNCIKN
ncbi:hypothetical protein BpHYR1_043780 [Brachionus plicatilis]|uniref:Uncharacterized protein n=1 Tax=Brachionus plicatilis TaxID=10195 RepID=A0A3M7RJZ8_BRAPC|nr:hypothetical protein BpHYR1_043780 [Brachionus plicatilis]